MSTDTAIPSPKEAIAASLSQSLTTKDPGNAINETVAPETDKETKQATPAVDTEPKTVKTLADSIVSDEEPSTEKKPVSGDEPREWEKPAAFIKRLKQELADSKAQLEQFKSKSSQRTEATPDEIAALRKEIAERDELLESTAFEKSRKFQEQFAKPLEKATTAAKDLISKFTDTKGVFEQAKALDGKERLEFLREHVGEAAGSVFDRMSRMDDISADRDAALKDRTEINKSLQAERETQNGAEVLKAFEGQRESISSKLSVYRSADSDALVAQAKSLLTGEASAEDIITAAYLAAAAPRYISQLKSANSEIATLKARIAEYDGDKPSINGRGGDGGADTTSPIKDGRVRPMKEIMHGQMR